MLRIFRTCNTWKIIRSFFFFHLHFFFIHREWGECTSSLKIICYTFAILIARCSETIAKPRTIEITVKEDYQTIHYSFPWGILYDAWIFIENSAKHSETATCIVNSDNDRISVHLPIITFSTNFIFFWCSECFFIQFY